MKMKIKMKMKKLLAILVVLALSVSFIPTAFAAEEAVNYNYVFNSSAHNLGENPSTADRRLTSGLHSIDNMSDDTSSAPWGFVNGYKFNSLATYSGYLNWTLTDDKKAGVVFAPGEETVSGVRAALAFEISASAGIYDASLSVNATETPTELEVYLIPKNEYYFEIYNGDDAENSKESFYKNVEVMSANYRIGKIDLYNKSGDVYIGRTKLSQSNYYLVLVPCGVNENVLKSGLWSMPITNFKLDGVDGSTAEPNVDEELNLATAFAYRNSGSSYTHSTENNVFSTENIQVRRYGVITANGPFVAFKVSVDTAGKYNLSFKTNTVDPTQAAPAVYLSETASASDMQGITNKKPLGYFDFSELTAADTYALVTKDGFSSGELAELSLEANKDYYIVLACDATSIALNSTTTVKALVLGTDYKVADNGTLQTMNGDVLGNSTHGYQKLFISGIKLTQVPEISAEEAEKQESYEVDRELYNEITSVTAENNTKNTLTSYSSTATVTVVAQDVATGDSVVNDVVNSSVDVNTEFTPSAPMVSDDYEFMYWAIGLGANRKIVSFDKDAYSFKVAPGRNMVYAVYRKINNDTKYAFFFDGSRTVMGRKAISDGQVTLPALPGVMPGFGDSIGWKYTGDENETALSAGVEVTDLTDDTFFVAAYNDEQTVTVTIDGTDYAFDYGTEVNLGDYAWVRENKSGDNVFNYWKKDNKIISFSPDYTFLAYEDCTLTSTYAKYEPLDKTVRRILVSADSETGITFAEFIGLDSAIEKGVLFGTAETTTYTDASAKAVMQTNANVFSVVNKTGKTAIGYAILSDGSIVYSDR